MDNDEKILIYAPTFRTISNSEYREIDFKLLFNSLQQRWPGKWKIFLRYHPSVKVIPEHDEQLNYLIDVSKYEGSQELIAASDVLISDYSSIMFEPAYIFKPVFLYAPDKNVYMKNERDFLLDYNSLPFPTSTTNQKLSEQIKEFNEEKYNQNLKNFLEKYGVHEDGHASERVAKFIIDLMPLKKD